jgi:pimeloyl-ACP methyl ester carboxylesterase
MVAAAKEIPAAPEGAPWLVMVHGMSGDHRVFDEQVRAFRDRYQILLVDLPGHGLSAGVPGPFGHRELAGHVEAALDATGLASAHYWGTHTGAAVGLLLALRRPARFASLILEGAVLPGRVMPSVARELAATLGVLEADGLEAAKRRWFEESGWFEVIRSCPENCRAEQHWQIVSDFGGAPWRDPGNPLPVAPVEQDLKGLRVPVLAYNGEHDLADFLDVAEALERLLPNVRHRLIAEAGGFPAWELPRRVNAVVADFLAEVDASREAARVRAFVTPRR